MADKIIVIKKEAETEITISKSVFVANSFICNSVDDPRRCLELIKKRFPDANHHCWAYRIGMSGEQMRYNDDGEPHGTAGPPILDVLVKKNITNTLIIVTRWFGGIKLGTGGLVRAYSEAAVAVLDRSDIGELIETAVYICVLPYDRLKPFENGLNDFNAIITDKQFTDNVSLTVQLPIVNAANFEQYFANITSGRKCVKQKTIFI